MLQNAKIFALISSALLLVSAAHPTRHHLEDLVKNLKNLDKLIKEKPGEMELGGRQTADVIDWHKCEAEDFCKAEKVLSAIEHKELGEEGAITRALRAFNRHFDVNCTVNPGGNQLELRAFLKNLQTCAQKIYPSH